MMILDESKLCKTNSNVSVFSRPSLLLIVTSVHAEAGLPPGGKKIYGDISTRSGFKGENKLMLYHFLSDISAYHLSWVERH